MVGRILMPFLLALALALLIGWPVILFLRRLKAGQNISSDAPERHQTKAGTPTMGGLIILAGALFGSLLAAPWTKALLGAAALTLGYALLGFLDDYLSLRRGKNLGLRAREKLAGQFLFAIAFVYWVHAYYRPVALGTGADAGEWGQLAWQVVQVLLIVWMSNAVNLTDGLDGLAAAVAFPVWIALAILATYAGGGDLGTVGLCAAFAGAGLGYLWFNAHPAQVFMGDTGSLPIGAAMAGVAILIGQEWMLLLAAGMHVLEGASVVLQVASFKATGRRIFRMAPLHHHFELAGWPETRVVSRFAIGSVLLSGLALWIVMGAR